MASRFLDVQTRALSSGVSLDRQDAIENEPSTSPSQRQALISTSQGSITFAVAPAIVTLMWNVLQTVIPAIEGDAWVALVLSAMTGIAIYSAGSKPQGRQLSSILFTIVNIFAITAAVLGIDSVGTSLLETNGN